MDNAKRLGSAGQALVEFSIALPILILLVAGVAELGRGYAYAGAASDAARDGARFVAGKTAATNGPGLVGHAPPFVKGVDYPAPAAGQAVVAVYCGTSLNCTGNPSQFYRSEVDVSVYYGFNDLNILGGLVTISGSSRSTTSW
jgi:hypothetical protein